MKIKIGQGIDVHKFKVGRKLMLGGIEIPYELGLDGHSDADVLIHSIIDALLGAAGMGDIGALFPDTDSKWKDADSREMLKQVVSRIHAKGYRVSNIDSTVMTEEPKLKPHIPAIRESLSKLLEISAEDCSVKAGTMEKMGFVGRQEGMMAQSVALIIKS